MTMTHGEQQFRTLLSLYLLLALTTLSGLLMIGPVAAARLGGHNIAPVTQSFLSLMLGAVVLPVTLVLLVTSLVLAFRLRKRMDTRRHLLTWMVLFVAGSLLGVWAPYDALTLLGPVMLLAALLLSFYWIWCLRDVWTRFTAWLRRARRR